MFISNRRWTVTSSCGLMTEEQRQDSLEKALEINKREMTIEELNQVLSTTIKRDDDAKVILFLACLLTYTESEQINIILSGESSKGKTYIINEVAWYFPKILSFDGASKTSFIHENTAILVDGRDLTPISYDDAPSKEKNSTAQDYVDWQNKLRNKAFYLDYSRMIIVLPDMPDTKLLATMRTLTDHSKKRAIYTITRSKDLKTKKVIIDGFFTPIYCTASTEIDEQEMTRFFLLTPEFSEEKIKDALDLIARKNSDENYTAWRETEVSRLALKKRVEDIQHLEISSIFIPIELMEQLKNWFLEKTTTWKPKEMRDFPRLISIAKGWTLYNHMNRRKSEDGKTLYCNQTDIEIAEKIYEKIYKSNELGLTPECLDFYEKVVYSIANNCIGTTKMDISKQYFTVNHRPCSDYRLYGMLKNLETIGLISKDTSKKPHKWSVVNQDSEHKNTVIGLEQFNQPKSQTDKISVLLNVLVTSKTNPMTLEEITNSTNGFIPKEEVPKLLQKLYDEARICQPDNNHWKLV